MVNEYIIGAIGLLLLMSVTLYVIFKKGENYGTQATENKLAKDKDEIERMGREIDQTIDDLTPTELTDHFNKL